MHHFRCNHVPIGLHNFSLLQPLSPPHSSLMPGNDLLCQLSTSPEDIASLAETVSNISAHWPRMAKTLRLKDSRLDERLGLVR